MLVIVHFKTWKLSFKINLKSVKTLNRNQSCSLKASTQVLHYLQMCKGKNCKHRLIFREIMKDHKGWKNPSRGGCKISSPYFKYSCNIKIFILCTLCIINFALLKRKIQKLGEGRAWWNTWLEWMSSLTLTQKRLKTNLRKKQQTVHKHEGKSGQFQNKEI